MIPPNAELVRLENAAIRRITKRMRKVRLQLVDAVKDGNPDYDLEGVIFNAIFEDMLEVNAAIYQKGVIDIQARYAQRKVRADILTDFLRGVSLDTFYESARRISSRFAINLNTVIGPVLENVMASGAIISERIKLLEQGLKRAGVVPGSAFEIETLARTSTNAFYQEAKYESVNDPDVAEIIWGYEYVTVGDDRVREEHAYMDGKRYPKDSSVWQTFWPPNGYNCRCDVIPIFVDDPASMRRVSTLPKAEWFPPINFQSFPGQLAL